MTYLDIEDEYGDLSFSRQRYEEYLLDEFSFDNESLSNLVETLEKFQVEFLNKKNYFEVITPLEENCMSLKTSADIELIEKQSDVSKSNKKKFPCTYQDCAKSYSAEKVLQTHIKTHTGIKLYKCDYLTCEKVYKSKENLNLHVKNKHLGVKPYKCSYCESHFTHRNGIL